MTLDEYRRQHATHLLLEKLALSPMPAVRAVAQNPLGQAAKAAIGVPFQAIKKGLSAFARGGPKRTGDLAKWRRTTGQAPTSLRPVAGKSQERAWKAVPKAQYEKGLAQSAEQAQGSLPASFYRTGTGATQGTYYQRRLTRGGLQGFVTKHPMISMTAGLGALTLPGQMKGQYAGAMSGVPNVGPPSYYSRGTY